MSITSNKLRKSINKELHTIYEGLNSSEARDLYKSITDLYEEISEFEKSAPPAAINALTPHLKSVTDALETMMQNPMSYVSKPLSGEEKSQRVELKPVKS